MNGEIYFDRENDTTERATDKARNSNQYDSLKGRCKKLLKMAMEYGEYGKILQSIDDTCVFDSVSYCNAIEPRPEVLKKILHRHKTSKYRYIYIVKTSIEPALVALYLPEQSPTDAGSYDAFLLPKSIIGKNEFLTLRYRTT